MDAAIVEFLKHRYQLRIGTTVAEQLRIDLGSAYFLENEFTDEVSGVDIVSGLPRKATVTSEEIRESLSDPLSKIVTAIRDTIDGCSPDLAADLVDNGIVLTGGGSLLRRIDRYVTQHTGIPCRVSSNPLTDVANGARICLEQFSRWRITLESSDDDVPTRAFL